MKYCGQCGAKMMLRLIDGVQRNGCANSSCGYVLWDNPTPVVAAIVETPEGVVLAHNVLWPAGVYGLVTGYLERNEQPEMAVLREVEEELGLKGDAVNFIGHYIFEMKNQLLIAYHVRAEGEISLGDELDHHKVIPVSKLKSWPFGTGFAVADWLKTKGR